MPTEALRPAVLLSWLQRPGTRMLLWLLAGIFSLSLLRLGATPAAVGVANPPWDKLLHFATYGCLAGMVSLALGARHPWRAAMLTALIGCIDEGLQLIEPGRHAGLDDLLADIVAAVLVAHACRWLYARIERHAKV